MDYDFKAYMQFKTDTPLIGTGKINRRYYIVSRCRLLLVQTEYKKKTWKKGLKKKGDLIFHSPQARKVLVHWNSKGFPFTKHKEDKRSKTLDRGLNKAYRTLKKFDLPSIIDAIDNCHRMFNDSWMKFNSKIIGINKLCLGDFFEFNKALITHRSGPLIDAGVTGWFEDCRKGEKHLRNKFGYFLKDENKKLTSTLKEVWIRYTEGEEISVRELNQFVTLSIKAVEFASLNEHLGISAQGVIQTIDNMINKFKTYKPKYLGWLVSDIFWDKELPKELVRFGTVTKLDRRKIKRLKTQWDDEK